MWVTRAGRCFDRGGLAQRQPQLAAEIELAALLGIVLFVRFGEPRAGVWQVLAVTTRAIVLDTNAGERAVRQRLGRDVDFGSAFPRRYETSTPKQERAIFIGRRNRYSNARRVTEMRRF